MARLVAVALVISFSSFSGVAQAADRPASPWNGTEELRAPPSFDIPDETNVLNSRTTGSRIIAGTELFPNTTVGFGMFGQKAEKSPHAPSIARELSLPKSRKAAVGLSLRF